MQQLDIKDYLQMNVAVPVKKKTDAASDYQFKIIFDNGSDFVIERSAKTNIKRQLCWIASDNLLFIREPKNSKDRPLNGEVSIKNFFGYDNHIQQIHFKNDFFNFSSAADFAYHLNLLHTEPYNVRRNCIKYGINPARYIGCSRWSSNRNLEGLDMLNFNKVLKVIKLIQEYEPLLDKKDANYFHQINSEFTLFLCRICDKFSIDYVRAFLDIYANSDSRFEQSLNDYVADTKLYYYCPTFESPIENYNLDFKRFCTYLFKDLYSQGIAEIDASLLRSYDDCLKMQKEVYGKVKDKYPEHFKECHDKVTLIYNLNLKYFQEKRIEELNAHNKELEYTGEKYSVIVAKTSQDLIEEGINLHHCVGSYVDRVKNGECSIFFLRKTDDIETSLITIEVRDDQVLQVRGLCERLMEEDERKFFDKWVKIKKLKFVSE